MISVITYGRNDSHGYNLPKRAAISLNCIAELLSDPDDEIIFVDYNTPNDLPTFIEAIYDTLTARTKRLLRVLRARPEMHHRLYGRRTHLAALEPIARNIAIRRSNAGNRWILSTNPDMIFVPRRGTTDLTSAVADLADGHYVLPRFDLPEPLWEGWPRLDPRAVIHACDALGSALHLNEVTVTYPFMRFDSPGDFQLIPRDTLFEVSGFDERMIHGWHVDSNMCRRMATLFGRTESLAERLKGYHCDHTRVPTLVHRLDLKLENDLHEFVWQMEEPVARLQDASWGLPDETIEEVDFAAGPAARYVTAVQATLASPQTVDYHGDANDSRNYVAYRSEHVLPYLAAYLTAYPPSTRFLYIGGNRRLFELLRRCLAMMRSTPALQCVRDTMGDTTDPVESLSRPPEATDAAFARSLVATHDVLIVDLGLDAAALTRPSARITDWPRALRYRIGAVAELLEACTEQCHELFAGSPERAPDFVVVNANPWVFHSFVSQFLFTTQTPYNIQVRKGRPRLGSDRLYRSHRWKTTEEELSALFGYRVRDSDLPVARPGTTIELTTSGGGRICTDGHWGDTRDDGTWIDGPRAELLFTVDPGHTRDLIAHVSIGQVMMPGDEPFRINVLFQGQPLSHWLAHPSSGVQAYPLVLPSSLLAADTVCRLAFEIDNGCGPAPTSRDAPAVMIRSVAFHGAEQSLYRIGTITGCTAGQQGAFYMNCGWTAPDVYGSWTLGSHAALTMFVDDIPEEPLIGTFTITDSAVSGEFPHLDVDVRVNGQEVDRWRLIGRSKQERKFILKPDMVSAQDPLNISFHIPHPRSPECLRWSPDDPRPLGFRLTSLRMAPVPSYRLGETIDFTEGGNAEHYLWSNWATPDPGGRWTEGEEATLRLCLGAPLTTAQTASFLVSDCMVDRTLSPRLPVQVLVNGTLVEEWAFGPERRPQVRSITLTPDLLGANRNLVIVFRVPEPRSPASLGWSGDARLLGIRLARACLGGSELLFLPKAVASTATWRARTLGALIRRWQQR
jgi:hypothetical protein